MNWFFKIRQWVNRLLMAYFIILFPQLQHNKSYYTSWYNGFDGFRYNAIGLRYDFISKTYVDLFGNQYYFDYSKQIYWNNQSITFDKSGLIRSVNKRWAMDFWGNHYYWCFITNSYRYFGFWSSGLKGHRLVKSISKPVRGPPVAARVFIFKTDPFQLRVFKTGFTTLVVSGFLTVNPIGELSVISQNNPPKSEQTRVLAEFRFKNLETFKQTKATKTPPITKRPSQKPTRVSASANQSTRYFDLNSQVATIRVSPSIDPSQYDTINLLEDLSKCLDTHTQNFLNHKQKQNIELDSSLKTGIRKVYKQLHIATNMAREKQEWQGQGGTAKNLSGQSVVIRLHEAMQKRAFDKNGKPIQNFNPTVNQQLREHSRFPLSGIKTLVAIKNDPEAALTKTEGKQITKEFAKRPYGAKIEALGSIRAHIIPLAWSTEPRKETQAKVLGLKFPFKPFPAPVIHNLENIVTIPNFLEKLLDDLTKLEAGVLPTILQKKYVYNPTWTLEKNYILANAIYDNFYMPALSENEKRLVMIVQKRDQMNMLETDKTSKSKTEKTK